jgi:hypothetical protein
MKALRALLVSTLVLAAGEAFANQAKLKGMLRKYAVDLDSAATLADTVRKAKTPCICTNGVHPNRVGVLVTQLNAGTGMYDSLGYLPALAADGNLDTVFSCSTFSPLGKCRLSQSHRSQTLLPGQDVDAPDPPTYSGGRRPRCDGAGRRTRRTCEGRADRTLRRCATP